MSDLESVSPPKIGGTLPHDANIRALYSIAKSLKRIADNQPAHLTATLQVEQAKYPECPYKHPEGSRCPSCRNWPYAKGGAATYVEPEQPAAGDVVRELLEDMICAAYHAGATDVHRAWTEGNGQNDPDFAEATGNYFTHVKPQLAVALSDHIAKQVVPDGDVPLIPTPTLERLRRLGFLIIRAPQL